MARGKRTRDDVRAEVRAMHKLNASTNDMNIHAATGVPATTIRRIVKDPVVRRVRKRPRTGLFADPDLKHSLKLVYESTPTAYLDEAALLIESLHEVSCSRYQVCRALKEMEYTRKKVEVHPKERDEHRRMLHVEMMADVKPEAIVYIDEVGIRMKTLRRTHGRAPRQGTLVRAWASV